MNKRKHSLYYPLLILTIVPILSFSLVIILFVSKHFTNVVYDQVKDELKHGVSSLESLYDIAYPGEYNLGNGEKLYKGENIISDDNTIIDEFKKDTGMEVSVFYGNTRYLTTIVDKKGDRVVDTDVKGRIYNAVLENKESRFYHSTYIGNDKYFTYYMPIINDENQVVGMLAVAKSAGEVDRMITRSVLPIMMLTVLTMIIAGAISLAYSKTIIDNLRKVQIFMSKVSRGKLSARLSDSIIAREDELGDMANSAVEMQQSLKKLIEHDALTGVLNRRAGEKYLGQVFSASLKKRKVFSVAMCDIDFFKKVNDTYGHETGDVVLKIVAATLEQITARKGVVSRWGGEEFLVVFENMDKVQTVDCIEQARIAVKDKRFNSEEAEFGVTMTFGVVDSRQFDDYHSMVAEADELLYKGKMNGRNR